MPVCIKTRNRNYQISKPKYLGSTILENIRRKIYREYTGKGSC